MVFTQVTVGRKSHPGKTQEKITRDYAERATVSDMLSLACVIIIMLPGSLLKELTCL